jgi:hypothetical protein
MINYKHLKSFNICETLIDLTKRCPETLIITGFYLVRKVTIYTKTALINNEEVVLKRFDKSTFWGLLSLLLRLFFRSWTNEATKKQKIRNEDLKRVE